MKTITAYHRNGVAGVGFDVECFIHEHHVTGIRVDFTVQEDQRKPGILYSLSLFENLFPAKLCKRGQKIYGKWFASPDHGIFAWHDALHGDMVGVWDGLLLKEPYAGIPFAVFKWDLLKQGIVEFGVNSWRSDDFAHKLGIMREHSLVSQSEEYVSRGGKRPGSGRKPKPADERLTRFTVYLTDAQKAFLRGNWGWLRDSIEDAIVCND